MRHKTYRVRAVVQGALVFVLGTAWLEATGPTLTVSSQAQPWVTTPLAERIGPPDAAMKAQVVVVDPKQTFQTMEGFGGCFNELGWTALQTLPPDKVQDVLKNLFDPTGANFNYCRMPIGANDYALDWYSLDDTPGDYALDHFSLARDEQFLIPYIKAATVFQPGMRLWGSDWSPPVWLKDSGVYNGGTLKMDPKSLSTYAAYLSRYVQEYRKRGINVVSVHVQNEPFSKQTFPSCTIDGPQADTVIRDYLGPQFAKDKPGADLWLGTINGDSLPFVSAVMDDPKAAAFVAGAGFQWAGGKVIGAVHKKYPKLPLMQTESECGNGSDDWPAAAHTWSLIHHYITSGAGAYIYWNMVLDETGLSTWGWKQNALVSILRAKHAVRYNPEFYVMEHLSAFVQPKATRIDVGTGWPDALGFRNPDGSTVVVLANFSHIDENVQVKLADKAYDIALPDTSIATVMVP